MTDTQEWYEDEEQETDDSLVKQLRKALKDKAAAEKAMEEEMGKLRQQVRDKAVSDVLKASGVHEKVARLIPANVDPTEEAVGEWLKEYGDLFGTGETKTEETSTQTEPDQAMVGQMQAMQQIANTAQTPGGPSQVTVADIQGTTSLDELKALIAKAQGG